MTPASPDAALAGPAKKDPAPALETSGQRMLVAPFLAGVLGAGCGAWATGAAAGLGESGMLPHGDAAKVTLSQLVLVLCWAGGVRFGFATPARGAAQIARRAFGALFYGLLLYGVLVWATMQVDHRVSMNNRQIGRLLAGTGMLLVAVVRWKAGRRATRDVPVRVWLGALWASAVFITAWGLFPSFRSRVEIQPVIDRDPRDDEGSPPRSSW